MVCNSRVDVKPPVAAADAVMAGAGGDEGGEQGVDAS
jgi:hypothetical protein